MEQTDTHVLLSTTKLPTKEDVDRVQLYEDQLYYNIEEKTFDEGTFIGVTGYINNKEMCQHGYQLFCEKGPMGLHRPLFLNIFRYGTLVAEYGTTQQFECMAILAALRTFVPYANFAVPGEPRVLIPQPPQYLRDFNVISSGLGVPLIEQ